MKDIFVDAQLRAFDSEKRTAEFVISDESVDRHRTVFVQKGGDFSSYNSNPIVCYAHSAGSTDPDLILGTGEVREEGGKTIGVVSFEDADLNPLAEKIRRKIESGTLKMASIMATVKRASFGDKSKNENPDILYFREWELVEWSIVPVGSNRNAMIKRSIDSIDKIKEDLLELEKCKKTTQKRNFKDQFYIKFNKNKNKKI